MFKISRTTILQNLWNISKLDRCWLSCVMGIIPFICQSKTITNDYFHLKNEGRDEVSNNNVLLLKSWILIRVGKTLLCFFSLAFRCSLNHMILRGLNRSSSTEVFYKIGILKNLAKFTGKHLCQSLLFDKVAGVRLQFYERWDSGTSFFLQTLRNF